jgi:hypothetical protein
MDDDRLDQVLGGKPPRIPRAPELQAALKRTQLPPDAPAPRLHDIIERDGEEPTAEALSAWESRVNGTPIIDIAHRLGLKIESAKKLIGEVHTAVHEDLKENLELNRRLDLERIDGMIQAFYPSARQGDVDCATVTLKCLQQRSKLTGIEAPPDPGRSNPQNILMWINTQMPNINRLVDSMPLELPPSAPGEHHP